MFTNLLEHEACFETPHGPVQVYSDYPVLPPGPSLTAEQVITQAEEDLYTMKVTGQESVAAFYSQREHTARKQRPKFYFAKWGGQRIMTSSQMPSKSEVLEALDEFRSANGLAPHKPHRHGEKFDELVGQLIESAGG